MSGSRTARAARASWNIQGVDLVVPAGTRTAIVGETGAGKTTLGYLAARLYEPQRGRVTIDGVDIRRVSLASLAATVGVVSQETYLFHASVRENLRFARPDATDQEVEDAARTARIHTLIESLPDGYDTVVGERGYRFSGGEKQRMAIARTVLRNPPVLVLDEATSSLDTQTEAAVQAELERLSEGRTTITIAHRLSTIRDADQIVVARRRADRRARHPRGADRAGRALRRARLTGRCARALRALTRSSLRRRASGRQRSVGRHAARSAPDREVMRSTTRSATGVARAPMTANTCAPGEMRRTLTGERHAAVAGSRGGTRA